MADSNTPSGRNIQTGKNKIIEHDERMVPQFHKGNEIYGEHIARYDAVASLVKDKVILDIASGSGYGTRIMAAHAKKVYGVDVSADAIEYSKQTYGAKNIEYLVGDGEKIPLGDASVDLVASFETIEHIKDYKQFLTEVQRILKDDGIFVVSTPNDLEFTEGNHFHLHQFEEEELVTLLKKDYKYVERFYQTTWLFNLIGSEETFTSEWKRQIEVEQTTTIPNTKVLYFYFVCSNRKLEKSELVRNIGAIGEHWSERSVRAKMHMTDEHIENLEIIAEDRLNYIRKLENDIAILQDPKNKKK